MNYLREIIAFNDLAEVERITPKEQAMWRAMMSIANSMGWASTFTVANLTLQSKAVLSEREVTEARNRLVQRGIITYKKSTGNRAPTYGLVSLADKPADSSAYNPATKCVDKPADSSAYNPATLTKLNETKQTKQNEDGAADILAVTDEEAQAQRDMIDRIEAKAKDYGLPFAYGDMTKAIDLAGEFTEEWLLNAIDRCSDRSTRNWGYIKGILRKWKEKGGMDEAYQASGEVPVNWA